MNDVRLIELAARQHRCVATRQLHALGYRDAAIAHRVAGGRLVRIYDAGNTTTLRGVPITTPERTLIDIAPHAGRRAVARAVREAWRLNRRDRGSAQAAGVGGGSVDRPPVADR